MAKDEALGGVLVPPGAQERITQYFCEHREEIYRDFLKALEWFASRWEKPELIKVERIWVNPPEDI